MTWIHTSAISSDERQPHDTRCGGWSGFRGLASVLSKMYSISIVVPAANRNGAA